MTRETSPCVSRWASPDVSESGNQHGDIAHLRNAGVHTAATAWGAVLRHREQVQAVELEADGPGVPLHTRTGAVHAPERRTDGPVLATGGVRPFFVPALARDRGFRRASLKRHCAGSTPRRGLPTTGSGRFTHRVLRLVLEQFWTGRRSAQFDQRCSPAASRPGR